MYNNLKEYLMSLEVFIDNEYLDSYIRLIEDNVDTHKSRGFTQRHHIVPRIYYRHNGLNIDNSPDNLVNLFYKDHIYAHYYLSLCSKDGWFKRANILSIQYTINNSHLLDKFGDLFNEEWRKNNLPHYLDLIAYSNQYLKDHPRDIQGEKNPFYGKKHTQETKDKISQTKKSQYTP